MKASTVEVNELEDVFSCSEAIRSIEMDYRNIIGGIKAATSGERTYLTCTAEQKIEAINRRLNKLAEQAERGRADECETSDYTFQIGALFRVIRRLVQNQMVAQEDIEERLAADCELAVADHYLEDFIRTMVLSDRYDAVWDIIAEEAPYSLKGLKEVGEKGCELPQAGQEPD